MWLLKTEEVEDVFVFVSTGQRFQDRYSRQNKRTFNTQSQFCTAHRSGPSHGAAKPFVSRPNRMSRCDGWSSLAAKPFAHARSRNAADKRIHSLAGQSDANPAGCSKSFIRSLGL